MTKILSVSDLKNYNEVLKNCHKGEPIYLTENDKVRVVVMDSEDYVRDRAEKKLLMKFKKRGRRSSYLRDEERAE